MAFYVYEILNLVNWKRYFGKAGDYEARWTWHCNTATRNNPRDMQPIHYSLRKYGLENFQFNVIFEFETEQESFNKEIELIAKFKTNICRYGSEFGYNLTDGGEGFSGNIQSKESREKLSNHKKGEKNPQAKLTEKDVKEIKIMILKDKSATNICGIYGVARKTIDDIKTGKTWQSVKLIEEDLYNINNILAKLGDKINSKILDKQKADEIRKLIELDETDKTIGLQYGVHAKTINDIRTGKAWRDNSGYGSVTNSKLNEEKVIQIKKLVAEGKINLKEIADKFGVNQGTINKINKGATWRKVKYEPDAILIESDRRELNQIDLHPEPSLLDWSQIWSDDL